MKYSVIYSPKAENHLSNIYAFIATLAGDKIAAKFVTSIIDYCDSFEVFPKRGIQRNDLRDGLRIIGFRKRVSIAFYVEKTNVVILGVYYGGQDFESDL